MKSFLLSMILLACFGLSNAQVRTNFNNAEAITAQGKFMKGFREKSPYVIPAKDSKALMEKETLDNTSGEAKPFRIAEVVNVDIDVVKEAVWVEDGEYASGKFTLVAAGAKSVSANFDKFNLPKGTELYVYSENGEMVTGPVTENENNENGFWGTWVYKGGMLTVELKTPTASRAALELHISSVAYGYKDIYTTEVGNFGESSPCNINVLCPLGNGWENERNAVALILNGNGTAFCSGALINNTCNLNIPYLLTANHCFDGSPVNWRFTFQAWSATCNPSQNANGITFNGSTLRARNAGSDFCLVEMNQTPPTNSNITLAGWSRNTAGIQQTTIVHHPAGDVMKISRDDQPPIFANFGGAQTWQLGLDQGATNGGSSGAPYFDQNRRIIAQHFGTINANANPCLNINKFGGRFDISWTGAGTNATRLSNWLDPNNTGAMTTNTRAITPPAVSGPDVVCTSSTFSIANVPAGANVTWISSNTGGLTIGNNGIATRVGGFNGSVTLTATIATGCGDATVTRNVQVGAATVTGFTLVGSRFNFGSQTSFFSICPEDYLTYWPITDFSGGITGYEWQVAGDPPRSLTSLAGPSLGLQPNAQPNTLHVVRLRLHTACGPGPWFESYDNIMNCAAGEEPFRTPLAKQVLAYPNPADGQMSITLVQANAQGDRPLAGRPTADGQTAGGPVANAIPPDVISPDAEVKLVDRYNQTLWRGRLTQGKARMSTAEIPDGLYYLMVGGRQPVTKQVMIRH